MSDNNFRDGGFLGTDGRWKHIDFLRPNDEIYG